MRPAMRGFTLFELVITLVLVGILASMLAPVYRQAGEMFADTRARSELTARGRLALERISRQLREAHPERIAVGAGSLRFQPLEDLLSVDLEGGLPQRRYRSCSPISINQRGEVLDWDIDDDGHSEAILVDGVEAVNFHYAPGTTRRSAVVAIDLSLRQAGQSVRLFREVHIRNVQGPWGCP